MYQSSVKYGAGVLEICEIRRGCIRTLFYTRWVYQNSVLYKVGVSEICVIQRGYIKTLSNRARVYENSVLYGRVCQKSVLFWKGMSQSLRHFGLFCHAPNRLIGGRYVTNSALSRVVSQSLRRLQCLSCRTLGAMRDR